MPRICLITGTPGVGKTTLCAGLVHEFPHIYEHIGFGRLIRDALSHKGTDVNEKDLRTDVSALVTSEVLQAAVLLLLTRLKDRAEGPNWVLLDSHAVSQDWYGFVATPDGASYFNKIRYSSIVHLFADPKKILGRSSQAVSGRKAASITDLRTHERIQTAITVLYSSNSECSAYFVDANKPEREVSKVVHSLLQRRTL